MKTYYYIRVECRASSDNIDAMTLTGTLTGKRRASPLDGKFKIYTYHSSSACGTSAYSKNSRSGTYIP